MILYLDHLDKATYLSVISIICSHHSLLPSLVPSSVSPCFSFTDPLLYLSLLLFSFFFIQPFWLFGGLYFSIDFFCSLYFSFFRFTSNLRFFYSCRMYLLLFRLVSFVVCVSTESIDRLEATCITYFMGFEFFIHQCLRLLNVQKY